MRFSGLALAPAFLLAGCDSGPEEVPIVTAPVNGIATYQGKPLEDYSIYFYSNESPAKQPSGGRADAEGRFTLSTRVEGDGAIVGKNQVWVVYDPVMPEPDPGALAGPAPPPPKVKVPDKYLSQTTSDFTVEVPEAGLTDYKLELK